MTAPLVAGSAGSGWTRSASTERGEATSGRANSACALIGTRSRASTSGQTIGPPAEKLYAVEPVGVAKMTPSQPHFDSGPAVDLDEHLDHPLARGLLHRGLVQGPGAGQDAAVEGDLDVDRHPFPPSDLVVPRDDAVDDVGQVLVLGLGEEADPAPG